MQPESAVVDTPPFDLDVGVIYTGEHHLMTPLVTTLAASGRGLRTRLILVDNATADGVAPWRAHFPCTEIVSNPRRLDYAANLNRILAASTARYALLLNTDMYFDPAEQCLTKMVAFMDAHPACGASICRIYHPDGGYGHPARRFQTLRTIAARRLGLSRLFARSLRDYLYLDRDRSESYCCDWISGCFMLLRRDALRQVGPFDSRFVKYFEDVDMCLRLAQAGWRVMFNGQTHCYHHEQRASRRGFSRDGWWHLTSYLRWWWKQRLATAPTLAGVTAPAARRVDGAHRPTGQLARGQDQRVSRPLR